MEQYLKNYLRKAEESLQGARSEFANKRYNNCANRCYYACFQSAIFALLKHGIVSMQEKWKHEFVKGQFVQQLINSRKVYPGHLRETLEKCSDRRHLADYRSDLLTEKQARRSLEITEEFVSLVTEREIK